MQLGSKWQILFIHVAQLLVAAAAQSTSKPTVPWWQLPFPYDRITLGAAQAELQNKNLIDSYTEDPNMKPMICIDPMIGNIGRAPKSCPRRLNRYRRIDGQCNDFEHPAAGSRFYRFGRNIPLNATKPDVCNLYKPNPREISRKLLKRERFIPATSVNILVAGWIQFMNHDWFDHGANNKRRNLRVEVADDDPDFTDTIKIPMTHSDRCTWPSCRLRKICERPKQYRIHSYSTCRNRKNYETFQNKVTHWWDASQLYGNDKMTNVRVRTGIDGKLVLAHNGRLPIDPNNGLPITGTNNNWWVGLGMFHIIWTKEHNYVCDMLNQNNPLWDDEKLFQTARLIISAVIAKIHTLEWTTAILNNDVAKLGLKSNWYGVSLMEVAKGNTTLAAMLASQFPNLINGVQGSVGNPKNIRGVPFSLTEEFVAVYRMHPLLPDEYEVRNHKTNIMENTYLMANTVFENTETVFRENSMEDLFYTFGNDHPGALTLHNYPNFARNLNLPKSSQHGSGLIDLATVDIIRDRERGIPRYNEFRRLLHMTPVSTFEELTTNPIHAEELREMYDNDVEKIDLMVGSFAESPLPPGFGFSDTFNRVFVIMARRRLEADRFFTDDYTAEVYTQWGLDYVDRTWMKDVLMRHYPSLSQQLADVQNAFIPWNIQTTI